MTAHRSPRVLVALLAAIFVVGCDQGGEVADFDTGAPTPDAPEVDTDLDVHDVEVVGEPPPRDAVLVDAGWNETAAWVRREVDAGRPVLVNLFASWCEPCKRELPLLVDAAEEEAGEVTFLGVDHQDQLANARAMVEEFSIAYPTVYDVEGETAAAVGALGMPTTVVFDRDGRLAGRVIGELTESSLDRLLDEVR